MFLYVTERGGKIEQTDISVGDVFPKIIVNLSTGRSCAPLVSMVSTSTKACNVLVKRSPDRYWLADIQYNFNSIQIALLELL